MNTQHRLRALGGWVALFLILFLLINGRAGLDSGIPLPISIFLPLHMACEFVAIAMAFMVFAMFWEVQKAHKFGTFPILGCSLLAVGLLDFAHALSYVGMPAFVTANSEEKALFFWLAARATAAAGLLWAAVSPIPYRLRQPRMLVTIALLLSAGLYALGLRWQEYLPHTYISGSGLTPFKIITEYTLSGIYLLTALLLFRHYRRSRSEYLAWLAAAALTLMLSELLFTHDAATTDAINLAGHLYKVAAHWMIYKGFFSVGVQEPYTFIQQTVQQLQASEQRNQLYKQVFETTDEALVITDTGRNIIAANPAFTAITGYSETEVLGKNPRLLASGRHDPEFYNTLWQTLLNKGRWSGEIWNRRKNGEIYPEWLKISTVRDNHGDIVHFVATFSDLSEIRLAQQAAEHLAWHDSLTGLPNRAKFLRELERALTDLIQLDSIVEVIALNLSQVKEINDALGLAAGDEYLCAIANSLSASLRPGDNIARLGSNEFALLLTFPHIDTDSVASHTLELIERLQKMLRTTINLHDQHITSHACFGITLVDKQSCVDAKEIIKQADLALRRAKRDGRDSIAFFEAKMGDMAKARFQLERELQLGILNHQLQLYLQPQVDGAGRLIGAEALVRWLHPDRGLIPPGEFIPLAEQSSIIIHIDNWVLAACCRLIRQLDQSGLQLHIAVNISPRHFQQADFVQQIQEHLKATGASAHWLTLEVTEDLMIGNLDDIIAKMKELSALGIHLSMDDFGTGYSSLSYLKRLPIHELKIDQSFIRDITGDANNAPLVTAIISVAKHLNLKVVAEGVETQAQTDFLNAQGNIIHQGYFFGRPEPVNSWITRWIDPLVTHNPVMTECLPYNPRVRIHPLPEL